MFIFLQLIPEYTFDPKLISGYKRRLIKRFLWTIIPLAIVSFVYGYVIRQLSFTFSLLITLIFLLALATGYFQRIRQQQIALKGCHLTTDTATITCTQTFTLPIRLAVTNITQVIEKRNGELLLKTQLPNQLISIMPEIEKREQLLQELHSINAKFISIPNTFQEIIAPYYASIITTLIISFYLLIKLAHR